MAKRLGAAGLRRLAARLPPNLRGALWVLLAMALVAVMSALVKTLGTQMEVFQIAFFRALFGLMVIVPFMLRVGPSGFATQRPLTHFVRGLLGVSAMMCGFYAITHMPLADATAITFTKPLFLVILAAPFLGETVGTRRWSAVAIGFVGALIMIRPGSAGVEWAALVALAGAFLVAVVTVIIKKLSETERPVTIMFYFGITSTTVAAIPAAAVWRTPTLSEIALLVLVGALGATAQTCTIRAYRVGEASAITPFDYSRLLFAGFLGVIFFAETPDFWTLAGAGVIVASTFYIARREARLRAAAAPPRKAKADLL